MTILRPATPDDAPQLAALGKRTFVQTFVEGFGIPYPPEDLAAYLATAFEPGPVLETLLDPKEMWWAAEDQGRILAFAHVGSARLPHPDLTPEHSELKRLYVDRDAQGLGLGRALLETALEWMDAHTTGPEWIGVWSGNLKAQRLYAHYGFEKAGEYDYPVGRWLDHEFILRRG
ncbi:GNAT family N-acetyltransferase [Brevundimonas sp. 2R-24]|uniref:GNAT family N-acetyltransferase n=1 Tax=Peiella sedimenti TaxID=3061083 RepID=A0ABT8SNA0_9CAUL|nr:GNAT family N-acetyltransferase [Caulobacteraceae bacterium XZ-24]